MVVDVSLVENAKKGNRKSFEELYMMVYKDMYRYAYFMLGSREDAEDAVSDAVFDAYKSLKTLKNSGAFSTWIFRILYIKCKVKRKEYLNKHEEISDNEYNSHDFTHSTIDRIAIAKELGKLKVDEREIVLLSTIYGYNSKEIGKILDLKSTTVRSKLSRALEKIKERMD